MYLIYENKVDVSRDNLIQGALAEWPEKDHLSCSGLFLKVKVALSFDLPLWLCLFSFAFLRLFHFCSLLLYSISPIHSHSLQYQYHWKFHRIIYSYIVLAPSLQYSQFINSLSFEPVRRSLANSQGVTRTSCVYHNRGRRGRYQFPWFLPSTRFN